jgi:G3E family GTPase
MVPGNSLGNNWAMQSIIIGGFLGAGKTTFLNLVLQWLRENRPELKVAVLVNEFGDIPVDTVLIEKKHYSLREVTGGCICCSLRGRLRECVAELQSAEKPDLLLLEATGLAVPREIASELEGVTAVTPPVVLCIDPVQYQRFAASLVIFRRQLEGADRVLLTRLSLAGEGAGERLRQELSKSVAPHTIFDDPALLIKDLFTRGFSTAQGSDDCAMKKVLSSPEGIVQKTIPLTRRYSRKETGELCKGIVQEYGSRLLRLKGLVPLSGSMQVFQYDPESGSLSFQPAAGTIGPAEGPAYGFLVIIYTE